MNLSSGNIHPVWGYDTDDVVCVVNHDEKKVHIGEIVSVDLKDEESMQLSIPNLVVHWWLSRPPKSLFPQNDENEEVSEDNEPYKHLRLSDRVLQAGDTVTHLQHQNKRGIVLSMDRKCDFEIVDRNQYICNVDCRKLITHPRGDPPRRVLYKGWIGIASVKACSVILRFHDGARIICPASVVNDFQAMSHSQRHGQEDPFSSHDIIVEGMVVQGDISTLRNCKCKFLKSTVAHNALMLSVLPKSVEAEMTIEKVITKGVMVDWLWNLIGNSSSQNRPQRVFIGKEMDSLTYIDQLEDVWYWGCRYDTIWSYKVEQGDVVIDNNITSLDRESVFYELYANENLKFGDSEVFYEAERSGVPASELLEERTLYRYTVKDSVTSNPPIDETAHPVCEKITGKLSAVVNAPLRQQINRSRRARKKEPEVNYSAVKKVYNSEVVDSYAWDSSKQVKDGQLVPVCVVRTMSTADVLWADGTIERNLPMSSFGFELFEDYMQAPQVMPGDLILPPNAPHPSGAVLQQTDWTHGYGVVLTYSSESRVCTVRWFDVSPDRRRAYPSTADIPTELGTWGLYRLESIARGLDRNNGLIFWIDDELDCAEGSSGEQLRVGLLKDIDSETGELVVQEYTRDSGLVRLFPCWPGIVPFTNVLTENEMIKLANNDTREFDAQVDEEDGDEESEDDVGTYEAADSGEGSEVDEEELLSLPELQASMVNAADWHEWRTVRNEDVELPGVESMIDISGHYEDFKEHCVAVASLFTDVSRINPMGLTYGFMELMDLGPIVVRMYRVTRDVRFHSAAIQLKQFGSAWCREIISNVCQPLLRRAWLPPAERSHSEAETLQMLGRLMTMIGEAARDVRNTVETLAQNYSRELINHFAPPELANFANLPVNVANLTVPPSAPPAPAAAAPSVPGSAEAGAAPSDVTENGEVEGATADVEKSSSITFVGEEEFRTLHHFYNEPHSAGRAFMKAWMADMNLLRTSLPDGIFVKACEERMDLLSFMLIGPEETPFEDAVFHFDVCLGPDYPNKPPKVFFHSYIKERLNPNLYPDGKVCLSLLGTWEGIKEGETWNPEISNLLQIIVSIQGLILNAEPFMNEPGHEKAQEKQRAHYIRLYNEEVVLLGTNFTANLLGRPPTLFLSEIKSHFKRHGERYVKRLYEWCKPEEEMLTEFKPKFSLLPVTRGFQLSMPSYADSLKKKIDAIVLP